MAEFIHPNWHVILIHYPLGLLSLGIVIELFSFLWRRSSVRTAGRWMIFLGALLSLVALSTGVYAFARVAASASSAAGGASWKDVVAGSAWGENQWQFMKLHLLLMCSAAGLMVAIVTAWIACSDHWRERLHWPFVAALLAGVGGMAAGAWYAGEGVYVYGVAVASQTAAAVPTTQPAIARLLVHPAQVHLLLVGITVALAVLALGLTIRRWTVGPRAVTAEPAMPGGEPLGRLPERRSVLETEPLGLAEPGMAQEISPAAPPPEPALPAPSAPGAVFAARWWLLAALLALLTGVAGLWVTEGPNWEIPEVRGLVNMAFSPEGRQSLSVDQEHQLTHLIMAICIILLPLILALVTRFSRRLTLITIIGLVMLAAAVGVQVWMGVLLLYNIG